MSHHDSRIIDLPNLKWAMLVICLSVSNKALKKVISSGGLFTSPALHHLIFHQQRNLLYQSSSSALFGEG